MYHKDKGAKLFDNANDATQAEKDGWVDSPAKFEQDKPSLDDVLLSLDHEDDAHWTKDGKPDLNVIKEKLGEYVSRGDMDKQYPDFIRAAE